MLLVASAIAVLVGATSGSLWASLIVAACVLLVWGAWWVTAGLRPWIRVAAMVTMVFVPFGLVLAPILLRRRLLQKRVPAAEA